MKKRDVKTLIKFFLCTQGAWLCDLFVFTVTFQWIGLYYMISKACSYTAGAVVSYSLNRKYTFRVTTPYFSATLLKFIAVNIVSITLSLSSMYLFVDLLHVSEWVGYFLSILFSFSTNYFGNRYWVFKGAKKC